MGCYRRYDGGGEVLQRIFRETCLLRQHLQMETLGTLSSYPCRAQSIHLPQFILVPSMAAWLPSHDVEFFTMSTYRMTQPSTWGKPCVFELEPSVVHNL